MLFAVLIAWLVLGELPTVVQAIGGTFIIAGIALVRLDQMRPARHAADDANPEPVLAGR